MTFSHTSIYTQWIATHVTGDVTGQCKPWCQRMQNVFPELTVTRGHVLPADPSMDLTHPEGYPHWWLVTPTGAIVDPTATQFPWPFVYEPWTEGAAEPTGKCLECGAYCYNNELTVTRGHVLPADPSMDMPPG